MIGYQFGARHFNSIIYNPQSSPTKRCDYHHFTNEKIPQAVKLSSKGYLAHKGQNQALKSGLSCSNSVLRTPGWQLNSSLVNSHFNTLFCKLNCQLLEDRNIF